ncbi:MAG: hypothetical protein K2J11_00140 [Oscillospiraceae bacterium]|nr:hypothetical protein [Oscillospiraceae bacterium]
MKMTLNALNIEHFKGIKRFGIAPNGANLSVTGRNKLGKTTIYDAFLWLLFGKNSAGETKFTIKSTNEPAETENVVEAQFTVDGKPLVLKKVYASKYVKTTSEYRGSELEYYINGVPKKKNEYEAAIAQIIDEEHFKLLTNPKHFTEVFDWKKRREILFSLAETKSDSELAAGNPDFGSILSELETMGNASELLKAVSAQVKKNSERINILPKLINENAAKLSQVTAISESDLAARNAAVKAAVTANNEKIGELKAWKPAESTEYTETKAELSELLRSNDKYRWEQSENNKKLHSEYESKMKNLQDVLSSLHSTKSRLDKELLLMNSKTRALTLEMEKIHSRAWSGDKICPTCGQAIPEEMLAQSKAEFDKQTDDLIAQNNAEHDRVRAEFDDALKESNNTEAEIAKVEAAIDELRKSVPVSNFIPFDLPEFEERRRELTEKLEKLSLQPAENPHTSEIEHLIAANSELEAEIAENMRIAEDIRRNADLNGRIAELKAEQAHLRDEQAKLQKRLDLANAFVRYKTDNITDSINGMFRTVKFKLFEPNKTNDGLQECCEAVAFGAARYGDINTAGKILAGIDIIGTLSERYGLSVPLFVDNIDGLDDESFASLAERVKGKMQLITLRVSEDAELRTEEF